MEVAVTSVPAADEAASNAGFRSSSVERADAPRRAGTGLLSVQTSAVVRRASTLKLLENSPRRASFMAPLAAVPGETRPSISGDDQLVRTNRKTLTAGRKTLAGQSGPRSSTTVSGAIPSALHRGESSKMKMQREAAADLLGGQADDMPDDDDFDAQPVISVRRSSSVGADAARLSVRRPSDVSGWTSLRRAQIQNSLNERLFAADDDDKESEEDEEEETQTGKVDAQNASPSPCRLPEQEQRGKPDSKSILKTSDDSGNTGPSKEEIGQKADTKLLSMMNTYVNGSNTSVAYGDQGRLRALRNARIIQELVKEVSDDAAKCHERWVRKREPAKQAGNQSTTVGARPQEKADQEARKVASKLRHNRKKSIENRLYNGSAESREAEQCDIADEVASSGVHGPTAAFLFETPPAHGACDKIVTGVIVEKRSSATLLMAAPAREAGSLGGRRATAVGPMVDFANAMPNAAPPSGKLGFLGKLGGCAGATPCGFSSEGPTSADRDTPSTRPSTSAGTRPGTAEDVEGPGEDSRPASVTLQLMSLPQISSAQGIGQPSAFSSGAKSSELGALPSKKILVPIIKSHAHQGRAMEHISETTDGMEDPLHIADPEPAVVTNMPSLPKKKRRIAEVPRLRNRFRDQRIILGGNFRFEACTLKRFHLSMADQLGLSDEDWDPSRAYEISIDDLKSAALLKEERETQASATSIQKCWRGLRVFQGYWSLKTRAVQAVTLIQRWWRRMRNWVLPIRRCVVRRPLMVKAAVTIQSHALGMQTRQRIQTVLDLHRVTQRMQRLGKDLGETRKPEVKLQACARGWLERLRLRRAREAAEAAAAKKRLEERPEASPRVTQNPRKAPPTRKMSFMHVQGRRGTILHHSQRGRRASEIVGHVPASLFSGSSETFVTDDLSAAEDCEAEVDEPILSLFERCQAAPISSRVRQPMGANDARMHGIKSLPSPRVSPRAPPVGRHIPYRRRAPSQKACGAAEESPSGWANPSPPARKLSRHRTWKVAPPTTNAHGTHSRLSALGGLRSELIGAPLTLDLEEAGSDDENSSGLSDVSEENARIQSLLYN